MKTAVLGSSMWQQAVAEPMGEESRGARGADGETDFGFITVAVQRIWGGGGIHWQGQKMADGSGGAESMGRVDKR
jgi:hypothetical protein